MLLAVLTLGMSGGFRRISTRLNTLPAPALNPAPAPIIRAKTRFDQDRFEAAQIRRVLRAEKRAANIAKSIAMNPCIAK